VTDLVQLLQYSTICNTDTVCWRCHQYAGAMEQFNKLWN